MAKLEVRTVEGITLHLEVAGPGTRFAAGLLDALLLSTLILGATLVLTAIASVDSTGLSEFVQGFILLGALVVVIAYHVLFHALSEGATPGKRAMGIRVVGLDGEPPSLSALILRGVLAVVDVLPVPLFLGLISIALTPRRQRLGDLVAGTLVARAPQYGDLEPWGQESWSKLQVRVLDLTPAAVGRFGLDDFTFLRSVITRRGMEPMRRRAFLSDVARHYRERLGAQREEDARAVIRELYLFLREHRAGLR